MYSTVVVAVKISLDTVCICPGEAQSAEQATANQMDFVCDCPFYDLQVNNTVYFCDIKANMGIDEKNSVEIFYDFVITSIFGQLFVV